MSQFNIIVPGQPVPLPRQRIAVRGGKVRTYKAAGPIAAYKLAIAYAARAQMPREPLVGAVAVELVFVFAKPKRAKHDYPSTCDIDNLVKSVLDALNGVAWHDDRQVTKLRADKYFGTACTDITIRGGGNHE